MEKKPFTILTVDNDSKRLSLNSSFLKGYGYAVLEATTGSNCLQLARIEKPDTILLADNLPDIDPQEVCRRLKSELETNHILVVLISSLEPAKDVQSASIESEADGVLLSPFSSDELRACILTMERVRRTQDHLLRAEALLEQRVRDRTAELEVINVALQKEIVERKRTEEKIKTSEMFFREITENSSDIILILNTRGILTYASPSVERYLGYSPLEMIGKSSFRFIHRDDVMRAMQEFSKAIRVKELAMPNSFRVLHKDGSERVLEGLGRNLLDNPAIAGFIMNVHDVTERRRMEEASRLFAHTLEGISEIVTITDLTDRFTFVNQAFLKAYGYERKEVIGQHVGMLWSPNNPEGLLKEILEQNRSRSWNGELLNLTKEGREFPISLHTSRIRNEKGEVIGLVGIGEDITERKRGEETLRESEAKYRELVEHINDAIFSTDINEKITYISPTAEPLTGYKPEDMIGHSVEEFIDPVFLPKLRERFSRTGQERLEPVEYRVKTKSGVFLWVRSSSRLILEGGKPVGMRGVLTDITAQKRAQETVTMLSHTIKSIAECVCITDHTNVILFVNQAFLTTYGYAEEELIGKTIDIVNPASRTVRRVLDDTLRGSWQGELVNRKKDGTEFPIYLSTSVVRDEEGEAIALVGVTTDITERKKIEQELKLQKQHLQESYEQLKQLEIARDTLFHMIVHDMRSHLTVLMMGLELLEKTELKNIKHANRQVLLRALSTTTTLSQMVNSLLDISKMESGEMNLKLIRCDLAALAQRLVSAYELQRENRKFIIEAPPKPVEITCDADLILRVIQNLFSNALKFTLKDGTITIKVQRLEEGARVSVEDTGTGISSHHLPKVFDKFYQAEARESSTGLGLTFCKLAVELHGGRIGVESEIGKGSTFWFILPSVVR
jgi:PAS domain S-box-containing protein